MLLNQTTTRLIAAYLAIVVVACSEEQSPTSVSPPPDIAPRTIIASSGTPPRTMDYEFYKLSETIPGFGGMFWTDRGEPVAYLQDLTDAGLPQTRNTLEGFMGARQLPGTSQISFRLGAFSWNELYTWREALREDIFSIQGVTRLGIDESANRISVGITSETMEPQVRQLASRLRIPAAAMIFTTAGYSTFRSDTTNWDHVRPVAGGLGIRIPISGSLNKKCTFTFRSGAYFIVPAHCTKEIGVTHNDKVYQPSPLLSGWLIGTEISDPSTFACARGAKCRWSDAALVWKQADIAQGIIYALFRCETGCPPAPPLTFYVHPSSPLGILTITEERRWPVMNELVNHMGAVSGPHSGRVVETCMDRFTTAGVWLLCQDIVNMHSEQGDSGAPIYGCIDFQCYNVRVYGMLVAGNSAANETVLSAMYNIEYELGLLDPTI